MPEQEKPFVVNDRRKFRADGELREPLPSTTEGAPGASAEPGSGAGNGSPAGERQTIPFHAAHTVTPVPEPALTTSAPEEDLAEGGDDRDLPPAPTESEIAQVQSAYDQTAERLDTMMRATNPGGDHLPPMNFTRLVQSVYMSAMVQLGAGTPQGQEARVDLLGAKQSIDMLGIIGEKSANNLDAQETKLLQSALFELRMGFLEITQMLARQAAAKQGAAAPGGTGAGASFGKSGFTGAGPRIVS